MFLAAILRKSKPNGQIHHWYLLPFYVMCNENPQAGD